MKRGEQLVYAQSPSLTGEEIESLLKEVKTARFCSLNRDGTIHAAPVWYKYENKKIIILTPAASHKAINVKRNRNVTILIDTSDVATKLKDFKGVIVYGKAEVKKWTDEILWDAAVSLCEKYMPRDRAEGWTRGLFKLTKWVIISVETEDTASFDYAKDEAFRAAVQG